MIRNKNSGGIEWNARPLDATKATIDAIPFPPRTITIEEVEAVACEAIWDRFSYNRHSPGTVPPGYRGWICIHQGITLRFLYKGEEGVRALHALQDAEQHDLPQALTAALTAVEYCARLANGKDMRTYPSFVARACVTLPKSNDQRLVRVKREEMEAHTDRYLRAALRTGPHQCPAIPSYVERARLLIRATEKLWMPELMATIQHPPEITSPLGALAATGALRTGETITLRSNAK